MLFPPDLRSVFRAACGTRPAVDDPLWERARGWALVLGVEGRGQTAVAALALRRGHGHTVSLRPRSPRG